MVTALRFGKPVPHTSSSAKGKEEKDQGGGSGKSRNERERETAAASATAAATKAASNKNDNCQKTAHNQRRQNLDSSSATNHVQCASSTQLNVLPLAKNNNNTYAAATHTQSGQQIQNRESGPLMPTNSASWRSMMHDEAKGSINSNGGNFRVSAPPPSKAAPTHTKAIVAVHKMSEEDEWIKMFNDVREYQYQHGYLPPSGWDNGKSVEEVDLIKWMDLQRHLYQQYLDGGKSALSHTRIDLLRGIGMIDIAVSNNVESKRMCMFWGCKRALGEYESFHCAEHRNVNTATLATGDPSTYNTSKRAVKRRKTSPKGSSSSSKSSSNPPENGTKHTLKSPPEEMLKNDSNPEETNIKEDEDEILNMVKLAAGAVAKEIQYLGLQPSSSTDHVESAIERFAVEVYCPLLYSSKERSVGTSSYSADRVLLSTLLALQEMLVTNAEKFFPLAGLKGSSAAADNEEAKSKLTRDIARALVQNAAKRLQKTPSDVLLTQSVHIQDRLVDRYLEASRRYESRGEDFQLALGRLDACSTYRNAKGSTLSGRESIMARTSFNFAREHHPLVRENDMLGGGQPGANPAPNACAIFVMGEGESVQKEDTMQTSAHNLEARHQKRTEVRESRIRLLKRYFGGSS